MLKALCSHLLAVCLVAAPLYVLVTMLVKTDRAKLVWLLFAGLPLVMVVPKRVCEQGKALFMLPVVPLLISLSFNVPIDVFHYLTEPFLREIAGQEGGVETKQWLQLFAQLATLFFIITPVYFVIEATHEIVHDNFESFFTRSRTMTNTKRLYANILPATNPLLQAIVLTGIHLLTVAFPASFAFNKKNTSYERGLALQGWLYAACQTASIIYHMTRVKKEEAVAMSLEFSKRIAFMVAFGSAIFTSLQESVETTPMSAARHFMAYFLGSGTVLCLIELCGFIILTGLESITKPPLYLKKSFTNWALYVAATGVATILLTLSNTTKRDPLASVGASTCLALTLLAIFPRMTVKTKGNLFSYVNPFMRYLIPVCFVAPLLVFDVISTSGKVGICVCIVSTQILFNSGSLPGLGPSVHTQDRSDVTRQDTAILEWFLNQLRKPFQLAYVLVLVLAVCTVIQEGEESWGADQGYFEPGSFTGLFTDPLEEVVERPAKCTTVLKSLDNTDCYSLCKIRWHGLDIMDLSLAASMAYTNVTNDGEGRAVLDILNDPLSREVEADGLGDWEILHNNHNTSDWVAFIDIYSPSRNVSVIAVRGSSPRFIDWLEDMSLFGEMTIFSLLSGLIPGLNFWPPGFFHSFLNTYTSTVGHLFGSGMKFFTPVVTYSTASLKEKPRQVVFVGHSLGGAVAKIAGTLVDRPAVGISSPGIMDSRKKFVHENDYVRSYQIRKLITNVYSQGDYVPAVGRLGGAVHELYCSEGAQCHSLPVTLCELYEKCPAGASGRQFVGSKRDMYC